MNGPNVLKRVLCMAVLLILLLAQGGVAAGAPPAPTGGAVNDVHWVVSLADSGAGSLRQAIADASAGDTIQFSLALPATIYLYGGELLIDKDLTIIGPGLQYLTISGGYTFRVFHISAGIVVGISDLTVGYGEAADDGGGIYNSGTLGVSRVTFFWNHADGNGGGIFNDGTLEVTDATFSDNTAAWGGGIYNNTGTVTVSNATFSGNTAGYGGGIWNWGTLTVSNATFSGNTAGYGGGISNDWTLTVSNATFSGNTATWGGGIRNAGTLYYANTIIANSTGGPDCDNSGTISQNVNNLVEDGSCGALYSGDPHLGPLGNYGGNTQTHTLRAPSQAIDHGDPATCTSTDQRGVARVGVCDIGAFEYDGYTTFLPLVQRNE